MQNTLEIIELANKIFPHLKYLDRTHKEFRLCNRKKRTPPHETPPYTRTKYAAAPKSCLVQDKTLVNDWQFAESLQPVNLITLSIKFVRYTETATARRENARYLIFP